jgi:RNA polymerase sigma-70 factor (ECF subfamily)
MVDLLQGSLPDADAKMLGEERGELVAQVVDSMPAHYREILLLSYFQRMSYSQISESLEIPLGTVKSRLHAAVANFADAWKAAQGIDPTREDDPEI